MLRIAIQINIKLTKGNTEASSNFQVISISFVCIHISAINPKFNIELTILSLICKDKNFFLYKNIEVKVNNIIIEFAIKVIVFH